jgi:hypothetical protein
MKNTEKPTAFLHGSPAYFVENLFLLTILFLKDSRVAKRRKRAVERCTTRKGGLYERTTTITKRRNLHRLDARAFGSGRD